MFALAFASAAVRVRAAWPCPWRVLPKWSLLATFGGFKRRVASFPVAGVALCDIPTCFIVCPNSFCVAGAILLRRFQKMGCIFGYFSWQAQHFTRIVLRVFANHIVGAASRGDSVQIPWLAWHFLTCAED